MKLLNIFFLKSCDNILVFVDVIILAFDVLGRTSASVVYLRVNITIVYEHTVCATTSAFSMCMLRVVFNVVLF